MPRPPALSLQGSPRKKPFVPWSLGQAKPETTRSSVPKDYPDELSDTEIHNVKRFYLWPLSAFNFFLLLFSGLLFGAALYSMFDETSSPVTPPSTWLVLFIQNLDVLLLFATGFLFVAASIGLIGTVRENIALLDVYRNILIVTVVLTTAFVTFLVLLPSLGKAYVLANITPSVIAHYRDTPDMMKLVNYVQSVLHCCGVTQESYRDWNENPYFNCSVHNPSTERCSVPSSCCRQDTELIISAMCGKNVMNLVEHDAWQVIYTRGCAGALFQYLEGQIISAVLIGMLFILFIFYLIALTMSVRSEVRALSKVYTKYYKTVFYGQVRMTRRYQRLRKLKGASNTDDERMAAIILGHQEPHGKTRRQRAPLSDSSPEKSAMST
ncbi:tetraspanin-33-like [Ixodes scapularis]|uniref:tetraspanin-33-like n=1 Tax=Ixodes scapularis TaxID=6945 RepID=UPI001A9FEF80|nr:tetraspanin-33-like [Ixodes scapularis]